MSVAGAFLGQAGACAALGSPFMARLMTLMAGRLGPGGPVGARVFAWRGDMSARGDAVPLRLAAGLHALALDARDAEVAAAWAAPEGLGDDALWAVVSGALERHAAFLCDWLDRAPQTNEVARAAVPIAVAHWLGGGRMVVSELGAAAGLNLLFDRWRLATPEGGLGPADAPLTLAPAWEGTPPPPAAAPPDIRDRAGVDLHPCDPVADRLRLLSYVWPDQTARLARMATALDVAGRARPVVTQGDAADWLEARLEHWMDGAEAGATHLVFHTIAWQYFPPATRARCTAALARAGAGARAPLAHLAMEADAIRDGAALTLTLWPGRRRVALGRADFHGRWLRWSAPAPLVGPAGAR